MSSMEGFRAEACGFRDILWFRVSGVFGLRLKDVGRLNPFRSKSPKRKLSAANGFI